MNIKSVVVTNNFSGQRLDLVLSTLLPQYSRSKIKKWILDEKVMVDNQIYKFPKKKVKSGELIKIKNIDNNNVCNEVIFPQKIVLNIIYEDNDIVVINKPSNMVVHPGVGNYKNTLLNALLYRYPSTLKISKRAGIVHRLDKDTSGIMIIAKTYCAYHSLLQLFKTRQVFKEYDAIVFGRFLSNKGIIDKPIRRHSIHRASMMVHISGKTAITNYIVLEKFNMYSRLRLYLQTGRTHQIRVHMAYIKHPLIGDKKYNNCYNFKDFNYISNTSNSLNDFIFNFNRQALHACKLRLHHPVTKKKMEWYAPMPKDMEDLVNKLKQFNNHEY